MGGLRRKLPTISQSALMLGPCLAWAADKAVWYDDSFTPSEKRDTGTVAHNCVDSLAKGVKTVGDMCISLEGRDKTYSDGIVLGLKAWDYFNDVVLKLYDSVQTEVAFGYSFDTKEVVTYDVVDRQYPDDGLLHGTADIVGSTKDGRVYVADWKTGSTDGSHEQLMTLAALYNRLLGLKGAVMSCISVFFGDNGPVAYADTWEATSEELESHLNMCAVAWYSRNDTNPPVPGIHCTKLYCPHLANCSAVTEKLLEDTTKLNARPLDDLDAGATMAMVSAGKRKLSYYETAVRKYLNEGGRAISGEFEYKETKAGFRWVRISKKKH